MLYYGGIELQLKKEKVMQKYAILLESQCGGGRTVVGPFDSKQEVGELMKRKRFNKLLEDSWVKGGVLAALVPLMPPSTLL